MSKKKYFPNRWRLIKGLPDEIFEELCVPFDEFMEWRGDTYALSDDIACIIRSENAHTGKVKEYVYKRPEYARKKVRDLIESGHHEVTIVAHDGYAHIPLDFFPW